MAPVIDSVRRNLVKTIDRLFQDVPGIRIGMIAHGDYCDYPNMCYKIDLSKDIETLKTFIQEAPNTGGGDAPECYEFAMKTGLEMNWKSDVRVFVIIGDQSPHDKGYVIPRKIPGFQRELHIDWKEELENFVNKKITIFSCHAQAKRNQESASFYAILSDRTGGFYFPLEELGSFPEYMVGICLKAADSAEDFQLIVQRQKELVDEAKEAEKNQDNTRLQELREETEEINRTIHVATSNVDIFDCLKSSSFSSDMTTRVPVSGMFSRSISATASKIKTAKKLDTPSRFDSYSTEIKTTNVTPSMNRFLRTLSTEETTE